MLKRKGHRAKHFRNTAFLKTLGRHCRKIRSQKGYSIDRLAKESDQLSPSVIHRLENGLGAVTVSALFRYAQVLDIPLPELLSFEFPETTRAESTKNEIKLLRWDDPRVKKEAFKTLLPMYSIKAAAGYFGNGREADPTGWVEVKGRKSLDSKMFVVYAKGESMLPQIQDGDALVFRADPGGSKQGKIVLAQYRGPADPESGGSYTVKVYRSSKVATSDGDWRHRQVTLSPLNSSYEPIILNPKDEDDFRIIAEYLYKL